MASTAPAVGRPLTAVVIGGTGAIGRHLVNEVVSNGQYSRVTTVGRRPVPVDEDKVHANTELVQETVDMNDLPSRAELFQGDVVFCTLGTTRADAGSAEAFRRVDLEYVTQAAKAAKDNNVNHFSIVTASNANKNSWFLYPKTKGEVEQAVQDLGFPNLSIFRPGLLERDTPRTVEKVAKFILPSSMAVHVKYVAAAMAHDSLLRSGTDATGLKAWSMANIKALEKDIKTASTSSSS